MKCTAYSNTKFSQLLVKMDEMGGTFGMHGMRRIMYGFLVWRSEGKRPLEKPRRGWDDDIKLNFRKTGIDVLKWIRLAQERDQWRAFVNTVMNLRVP